MTHLIIKIEWVDAIEFVQLDLTNLPLGDFDIHTSECWPKEPRSVSYVAVFESHRAVGTKHSFKLRYKPQKNPDLRENEHAWGITELTLDTADLSSVSARWTDDKGGQFSGAGKVTASYDSFELKSEIERETFERIQRPEQFFLRQRLLAQDKKCALSEETTHKVLEVAHIVEKHDRGACNPSNSFLLRVDLHRLFDARLISIDADGKVRFDPNRVSQRYADELSTARLDEDILKRVADALLARN